MILQCYMHVACMEHRVRAIIEPTARIHVQNFAGSRIKLVSC